MTESAGRGCPRSRSERAPAVVEASPMRSSRTIPGQGQGQGNTPGTGRAPVRSWGRRRPMRGRLLVALLLCGPAGLCLRPGTALAVGEVAGRIGGFVVIEATGDG